MPLRSLGIVVALLLVAAWLILRSDPETLVRDAHAQLADLISKSGDESAGTTILNARALQNLFAARVEISGDADGLTGSHSPEDLAATIIRLRSVFQSIELTFGELAIAFVSDTQAVVEFSAALAASSQAQQVESVSEARQVTSRLQEVDGEWLFSDFQLAE
jgi:hypothetical protein